MLHMINGIKKEMDVMRVYAAVFWIGMGNKYKYKRTM